MVQNSKKKVWSSQRILIKISGNNGCLAPVLFMYSNHFTIIKKYNFDNKNGIYFFLDLTQFPNFEWWYWIEKHIFFCLSFINIIPMWHPIVDYTSFDNLKSKIFFCSNPIKQTDRHISQDIITHLCFLFGMFFFKWQWISY